MDWYYTTTSDEQGGPVDENQIKQLVLTGTIAPDTSVWNESMEDWQPAANTDLKLLFPQRKPPPPITKRPAPASTVAPTDVADSFARDPQKVYPSSRTKSPHWCWLNLILPGLAQIVLRQGPKGGAIIGAYVVGSMALGFPGLLILIASIPDAFMTAKVLQQGKPVGKWQFFPSA